MKQYVALFLAFLIVGCVASGPTTKPEATSAMAEVLPSPEEVLPADDVVPGWSRTGLERTYDSDTLYDFMNGAADLYFTYGFEELAVSEHEHDDGGWLRVEVYRLATDQDAFGLYTYSSFGEPLDLGVDGRWDGETGLAFWQGRTFVQVVSRDGVDGETLYAFGKAVAGALPQGGKHPLLLDALPRDGLVQGSERFFREQMALDNLLWLGSDNVLDLGPDVEGVLAEYRKDDAQAILVLVAYPDAGRAESALQALQEAAVDQFAGAKFKGNVLGAVFGELEQAMGAERFEQALEAAAQG